jgi:glycine hydroxymethyltransferase
MSRSDSLAIADPDVAAILAAEGQRQELGLELIASENSVSRAVLEAQGSVLTNKYAEGYPGKRYYGGCEEVDKVEQLAIDRVKALYGAHYSNVQPHSGSQANQCVYTSVLKPGDTILGMSLAMGGHLTHGASVNLSGKLYKSVSYGLDADERLDYAAVDRMADEHRPKMIVAGASAYARVIDWARLRATADRVGALLMADMAHYAGLIAAGLYPNPVGHAHFVTSTTHKTLRGPRGGFVLCGPDHEKAVASALFPGLQGGPLMHVIAAKAVAFREAQGEGFRNYQAQVLANARAMTVVLVERGLRIVSGGTDCHLILVDLRAKHITGVVAQDVLGRAHMTVNKNAIPNDPEKPMVTSGIRIGTPAITSRGLGVDDARQVAHWIADALEAAEDAQKLDSLGRAVQELCRRHPVYMTQQTLAA